MTKNFVKIGREFAYNMRFLGKNDITILLDIMLHFPKGRNYIGIVPKKEISKRCICTLKSVDTAIAKMKKLGILTHHQENSERSSIYSVNENMYSK